MAALQLVQVTTTNSTHEQRRVDLGA
jgi:hypothetical protein